MMSKGNDVCLLYIEYNHVSRINISVIEINLRLHYETQQKYDFILFIEGLIDIC
jgi:hypothetical protein